MLDLNLIREQPDLVRTALKNRQTPDPAQVLPFAQKHEARVGALQAACWNLPHPVTAAITHWREPQESIEYTPRGWCTVTSSQRMC